MTSVMPQRPFAQLTPINPLHTHVISLGGRGCSGELAKSGGVPQIGVTCGLQESESEVWGPLEGVSAVESRQLSFLGAGMERQAGFRACPEGP